MKESLARRYNNTRDDRYRSQRHTIQSSSYVHAPLQAKETAQYMISINQTTDGVAVSDEESYRYATVGAGVLLRKI